MASKPKALEIYEGRITEEYLVAQVDYHYDPEYYRDHKNRMSQGDMLYRGDLAGLFPEETKLPNIPYVENKFKNALHDIARLSSEGKGSAKFIPEGDRDKDMRRARVRESIVEGYWRINKLHRRERQLYLDCAGSGMMALAAYYNDQMPYPQATILDPRFCYPDVRDGKLYTMLKVEEVKERTLARQFPHLDLNPDPRNRDTVLFACYYDDEEVAEAVVLRDKNDRPVSAHIVKRWQHGLGRPPVAFEMLDTYDRAFHGLFEQLKGPLLVRNKTVRFLVDLLEQAAHAPIFSMGVSNPDEPPGPFTIYLGDPNAEKVEFRRVEPASASGDIWRMLSYMQDQEEKEAIQPPARSGNVSQSIASGSFVDRTQGQLTSVVKEQQDKMASLREQFNEICMQIDEAFMDSPKPLIRPVDGQRTYTPSEDIRGWYFHEVKFGAGAGLDRLQADVRVERHLAARLISREEARAEIDYLDDSASSQEKIDREALADAILQRFVRDPNTPMSALAQTWLKMKKEGKSLEDALEEIVPEIIQREQPTLPAGAPEEAGAAAELLSGEDVALPSPILSQAFLGRVG